MASQIGTVTSSRLNLRRDPSMDHPAIVSLPQGAEVEVIGREGPWYQVRFAEQVGFVSAAYVSVRPAPTPPAAMGRVSASTLNLRSGPSTAHPAIGQLPQGAPVEILESLDGWLRVRAGSVEGFASAQYVSTQAAGPAPAGPAAPVPAAAGSHFLLANSALQQIALQPARQLAVAPDMAPAARSAARTWNSFGGLLEAMSEAISVPSPAAVSVLCVESGGAGFKDERMIIRFENHVFFNYWGKKDPERFKQHFSYSPEAKWKDHKFRTGPSEPWAEFHGSQDKEWAVFAFARTLDEAAAMNSISMGAPQIMGFNSSRIGYASVQEMFAAFSRDVRFHILGMFDFIRSDSAMVDALKTHQYEKFAARYNGTGQAAKYGALIQQHSEACAQLLTRTTPTLA